MVSPWKLICDFVCWGDCGHQRTVFIRKGKKVLTNPQFPEQLALFGGQYRFTKE